MKKYFIFLIICVSVLVVFGAVGYYSRVNFLTNENPFPSWTYNSKNQVLNSFTSWDSGFYYDIAKNWYHPLSKTIPETKINVPAKSWTKVYLGSGLLGEVKFALPYSGETEKVNNVVFLINDTGQDVKVPIFYPYEGINYCNFSGDINYERDILVSRESLSNSSACGDSACTKSYVTYFTASSTNVLFQEVFLPDIVDPQPVFGTVRPTYSYGLAFASGGCTQVANQDISYVGVVDPSTDYTSYAFGPLYSAIVRLLGNFGIDLVVLGVVLSFIFFVLSAIYLNKLLVLFFDEKVSFWAVCAYLLFPFAFFNVVFLPVSIFNFLFFACLYYSKKGSVLVTSIALVLLVLSNVYGLVVLLPMFAISGKYRKFYIWLFTGLATLFAWAYYLFTLTGDYLTILTSKVPWYGNSSTFVGGFVNSFLTFDSVSIANILGFLLLLTASILCVKFFAASDKSFWIYMIISFFALSVVNGGLSGLYKYYGLLIPIFVGIANLIYKKKIFGLFVLGLFIVFLVFFSGLWSLSSAFII